MSDLGAQQDRSGADGLPHHPRPSDDSGDELEPSVALVRIGRGRSIVHHAAVVASETAYGKVGVAVIQGLKERGWDRGGGLERDRGSEGKQKAFCSACVVMV